MTDQEIIELIDKSLAEEFELDPAMMTPGAWARQPRYRGHGDRA